ncbi:MAG: hypothetical protein KF744_14485 [Taibaiella sp.]|nr:hypothetical protein [Taibaiella sp.]
MLAGGYTEANIHVNSYSGHVGDAMAMHDLIVDLNTYKGWNINTYGCVMLCSSSTYLVMAGKNGGEVSSIDIITKSLLTSGAEKATETVFIIAKLVCLQVFFYYHGWNTVALPSVQYQHYLNSALNSY